MTPVPPRRFLLTSLGSLGDVYPLIGIARGLAARGHDVTMLTNDRYATLVRDAGVTFVSPGEDGDTIARVLGRFDIRRPHQAASLLLNDMMLAPLRPVYARLLKVAVPGETVLISFPMVLSAQLLAERLSIPHVTAILAPSTFRSVAQPPRLSRPGVLARLPRWAVRLAYRMMELGFEIAIRRTMNRFRRELAMPPIRGVLRWLESSELLLGLYPEWFAPPPPDLPSHTAITHFPLFDARESRHISPALQAFLAEGPPPVVFTLGSPAGGASWFHRESAQACEILGCRGILVTQYQDDVPEHLPEGVLHIPFAPFSELLPQVAAFVHHGGIGSCAQALAAGVPQLVVPWGVDQFDNALRIRTLGVGEEHRLGRYRGPAVADRLMCLIDAPVMRARCREVAQRCAGEPLQAICDRLERFAETHTGVSQTDTPART